MKNISFCLLIFLLIKGTVFSQTACLPLGITFSTQEDIDNFPINFPGCTKIEGQVLVSGANITNLNGLSLIDTILGSLNIKDNAVLSNLNGLNNLSSIGNTLLAGCNIENNPSLANINGLESLRSIAGGLRLYNNPTLQNLQGLEALVTTGGGLHIQFNTALNSLEALNALSSIGDSAFGDLVLEYNCSLPNLIGLEGLSWIKGEFRVIDNEALVDFSGLEGVAIIEGAFNIEGNDALINFDGLNQLTTITGYTSIWDNDALISFHGLEGLTTIQHNLQLFSNDRLTNCAGLGALNTIGGFLHISFHDSLSNLTGLESLTSLGSVSEVNWGDLRIDHNPALTSLSGLMALTLIRGDLDISDNAKLPSLSGIDHIDPNTINFLIIENNPVLSVCDVTSVCDFIMNHSDLPAVNISSNALNCNSEAEVEERCMLVGVKPVTKDDKIILFPNPAAQWVTFLNIDDTKLDKVSIYHSSGQLVLQAKADDPRIDISSLISGIYLVKIQVGNKAIWRKLMVN